MTDPYSVVFKETRGTLDEPGWSLSCPVYIDVYDCVAVLEVTPTNVNEVMHIAEAHMREAGNKSELTLRRATVADSRKRCLEWGSMDAELASIVVEHIPDLTVARTSALVTAILNLYAK